MGSFMHPEYSKHQVFITVNRVYYIVTSQL